MWRWPLCVTRHGASESFFWMEGDVKDFCNGFLDDLRREKLPCELNVEAQVNASPRLEVSSSGHTDDCQSMVEQMFVVLVLWQGWSITSLHPEENLSHSVAEA